MDPKEFCDLFEFAGEVGYGGSTADVIPHPPTVGMEIEDEDGSTFRLSFTDVPMNRIGLAITRRFSAEPEKAENFLMRYFAFSDLKRDKRMKKFIKKAPKGLIAISEAVLRAAALCPMTRLRFESAEFFALAERLLEEEEST
jgi:hypothetical protein